MGTLIMFVGVGLAFVSGLLYWTWLAIMAGAALWAVGYFIHKPQALNVMRDGGALGVIVPMLLMNALVCAVVFGLGRLASNLMS